MTDHRLLNGRAIRDRILDDVAVRVRAAAAAHQIGRLISINIGEQKEAAVYVRGAGERRQEGRPPLRGRALAQHPHPGRVQGPDRRDE